MRILNIRGGCSSPIANGIEMKLTLKQMLEIAEIAKPAYDSRRRRDLYGFLHTSEASDTAIAESIDARRYWGMEHVVGMMCVEHASRLMGMTLEMADSIVSNNFGELAQAVAFGEIDPAFDPEKPMNHFYIGKVFNLVGGGHHAGLISWIHGQALGDILRVDRDGDHVDNSVVGIQVIDATTVYRQARSRATELKIA